MVGGKETILRKELAILLALGGEEAAENRGLAVTRLASLIGREKSQVSRSLGVLAEVGFVERDPSTQRYRLGWRLFTLAAKAGDQRLLDTAPPLLERLMNTLGETAHLSVLQGTEVLTILSESPPHAIKAVDWAGLTVPAYCTSSGRVLLFDRSRDAVFNLLSGTEFSRGGPQAVEDVEELYERVVAARALGYALVDEEFEPGLVAVAAPIRDFRNKVIAALNVSAPKFRLGEDVDGRLENIVQSVKSTADELSSLVGGSPNSQTTVAEAAVNKEIT